MASSTTQRGRPDFLLLFLTFCLVGFGLVMIFSASSSVDVYTYGTPWYHTRKQIIFAGVGLVLMFIMMNINTRVFQKLAPLSLLGSFILLALVLVIGDDINGAKRWFGIGPFGVQPSEFAKLAIILYVAAFISRKEDRLKSVKKGLVPLIIVFGLIALLIMKQPDFGTTVTIALTVVILVFVGGAQLKHMIFLGLAALPVGIYALTAESYRLKRLTAFLDPWQDPTDTGFHLIQSLYAFSHGGIDGAGFGQSIQKLHYLPFAHTDFIFPIIAEEFGFIGSALFLLLYVMLIARGLQIAVKSGTMFSMVTGVGIVSIFTIQALFNLGGVTGSIPITGTPLPLISYGGSSLMMTMGCIGILLSISRQNQLATMVGQETVSTGLRQRTSAVKSG